ncbi:hypothetical protein [Vogesella mureinivorans]|uniref:hypothetical protein n=1 Tax=Vogesella mureinivorans TaxID=657276 RepID=UPI0011C8DD19|nr:hypothetical protein [Vogesella mureinivorans]
MAKAIKLKNPHTGLTKTGYIGFSWTTFFFGFFPALFRGDFITFIGGFIISIIIALVTAGIGAFFIGIIWAFMYNKYYTRKLIEKGYQLNDTPELNREAASILDISSPTTDTI